MNDSPEVYKAIKFTGKNGKEVRNFLDESPVVTRAGNGWVKITPHDSEEITIHKDWWLLRDEQGAIHWYHDSVLRVIFKRYRKNDPTRWVVKATA